MKNVGAKDVNAATYFGSKWFRAGYEDARSGLGFCDEYETLSVAMQGRYERGRMFAVATGAPLDIPGPKELKGSATLKWINKVFTDARREGAIA